MLCLPSSCLWENVPEEEEEEEEEEKDVASVTVAINEVIKSNPWCVGCISNFHPVTGNSQVHSSIIMKKNKRYTFIVCCDRCCLHLIYQYLNN